MIIPIILVWLRWTNPSTGPDTSLAIHNLRYVEIWGFTCCDPGTRQIYGVKSVREKEGLPDSLEVFPGREMVWFEIKSYNYMGEVIDSVRYDGNSVPVYAHIDSIYGESGWSKQCMVDERVDHTPKACPNECLSMWQRLKAWFSK